MYGGCAQINSAPPLCQPWILFRTCLPDLRLWGYPDHAGHPVALTAGIRSGNDLRRLFSPVRNAGILHQLVHGKALSRPMVGLQPEAHEFAWPYLDWQSDPLRVGWCCCHSYRESGSDERIFIFSHDREKDRSRGLMTDFCRRLCLDSLYDETGEGECGEQ